MLPSFARDLWAIEGVSDWGVTRVALVRDRVVSNCKSSTSFPPGEVDDVRRTSRWVIGEEEVEIWKEDSGLEEGSVTVTEKERKFRR